MNTDTAPLRRIHHGRNIKRLRDMLGVKQDVIAVGLDITQQSVSELEQKEEIEDITLGRIAKILNVPVAAIKNMDDNAVHTYISTFYDNSIQYNFNPIEKIVQLYDEKTDVLERWLKSEQEKNTLLQKIVDSKK